MVRHKHLPLPQYVEELPKRNSNQRGGGFKPIGKRDKVQYHQENIRKANQIAQSFTEIKQRFRGTINPHLIYRIKVNQSVDIPGFEKILNAMGELTVLSVAENRQGYWVVFANDEELSVFKNKLAQYSGVVPGGYKYEFFHAIDGIEDIPIEEKIGEALKQNPLQEDQLYYLNVELWRMDDEILDTFIRQLSQNYRENPHFSITDKLIMRSFALLRVRLNKTIFDEIIMLKEIARIEIPMLPKFNPSEYRQIDVEEFEATEPPEDATGILVIDSGIVSNHPLLEKAVGDEQNFQEGERQTHDVAGHGTAVAGNSIYYDIERCIEERKFSPTNWLFSAKVMYAEKDFQGNITPVYDPEKLFENQLNNAIRSFLNNVDYRIKVVNISFGNSYESLGNGGNRQFPLANLIDELALEYRNVVFVISAGNQKPSLFYDIEEILKGYPNYLVENKDFKIINPATSALSLTVGSIATSVRTMEPRPGQDIWHTIADAGQPSPFSRTGFGINGMMKPEVVEYGGNLILRENYNRVIENIGGKIALLSNNPTEALFSFDIGTSFSAPKVSNLLGQIANSFPDKSANYIKNLLLQSTELTAVPNLGYTASKQEKAQWQITGYGIPNVEKAIYSLDNRIVLLDEGVIGLNRVKTYSVNLPSNFFETKGTKKISAVLTFDPIVRATRGDSYLGAQMEFKLFHTVIPDEIIAHYAVTEVEETDEEDTTPTALKPYEIVLKPGVNIRNKGCHQKAIRHFKTAKMAAPITLVVRCLNKWISDLNYTQNYCISLTVEHSAEIDIYSSIRTEVLQRTRVR